jgi:eukaryotic-like serine/threonine-protein kinase
VSDDTLRMTGATLPPVALADQLVHGVELAKRYRIGGVLGSGGMGVVYAAQDLVLDRPVVVKVMRPELKAHVDLVRRFENEAKIVASLFANPHIVNIYDLGRTDAGDPYLVMELLRGKSLRSRIDPAAPTTPSRTWVIEVVQQIASALADAHRSGVAHRDLKPENVFVVDTHTRIVKVLDFGLAVAAHAPLAEEFRTRPGDRMGTPAYMSPEAVRGEAVGAPADIYALGVMFHELATNQLPYDAKSYGQWMRAHELDVPKPFGDPRYPARVKPLIKTMLDKDPDARPRAKDVYRQLQTATAELEQSRRESWES